MTERNSFPKKGVFPSKKEDKMEETYGSLGVFWSLGWRVAIEWGSAVAVGGFLGSLLDDFFESEPICFVVGLLLGSAAGVLSIYIEFPLLNKSRRK